MTDTDVLRELAWLEVEMEAPSGAEEGTALMDDDQFEREVALAAEGRWSDLELDELPNDWEPVTIGDLRDA